MRRFWFVLLAAPVIVGCASTPSIDEDPYRDWNLFMYKINRPLHQHVAFPVISFYQEYMPQPLQQAVENFSVNFFRLQTIVVSILQLDLVNATKAFYAMSLNTLFGVGGLVDLSGGVGIDDEARTFSDMMRTYGWRYSHYLELPGLGPSTTRDAFSLSVSLVTSSLPYQYYAQYTFNEFFFPMPDYVAGPFSFFGKVVWTVEEYREFMDFQSRLPIEVAYDLQRRLFLLEVNPDIEAELNNDLLLEDPDLEDESLWGEP